MKRYTYKHKKTGAKLYTDNPLKSNEYVLIAQLRDGQMKAHKITTKRK